MNFYLLTHPPYGSDRELARRLPVWAVPNKKIPQMWCSVCGVHSAFGSQDLRVELPSAEDLEAFKGNPELMLRAYPAQEWLSRRGTWARLLGVPEELIRPGASFGPPLGEVHSLNLRFDFVYPSAGAIWVKEHVKTAIEAESLTGVRFMDVRMSWSKRLKKTVGEDVPLPRLWELVVTGRAPGRPRLEPPCPECGRQKAVSDDSGESLLVDESTYDGSDFFIANEEYRWVLVTNRVCELFEREGYTNWECQPYQEFIEQVRALQSK